MVKKLKIDGKKLLQLRTDNGWSRKYIGDELGITESAISRWEEGKFTPKKKYIESLIRILGDNAKDLFYYKDEKEKIDKREKLLNSHNILVKESTVNNSFNHHRVCDCNAVFETIEKEILSLSNRDKETLFDVLNIIKKHKK